MEFEFIGFKPHFQYNFLPNEDAYQQTTQPVSLTGTTSISVQNFAVVRHVVSKFIAYRVIHTLNATGDRVHTSVIYVNYNYNENREIT